jgi:hypothetical protein
VPDAEKLATARSLLGSGHRKLALGPYSLYTDWADDSLLQTLGRLLGSIDGFYRQRYGLEPLGQPKAALLLFTQEAPYRQLQSTYPRLRGLHSAGFNAHGLAVSYVAARRQDQVLSTLVHEVAHLINRRALGPALPPWLDEGIADDLAMLRIDAKGALVPGSLLGERVDLSREVRFTDALASIRQLDARMKASRLRSLEELLGLDWDSFVGPPSGPVNYAHSAFWMRFLLTASQGRRAKPFQIFLRAVAEGEPASAGHLGKTLEADWPALDSAFKVWLAFQTERPEFQLVGVE